MSDSTGDNPTSASAAAAPAAAPSASPAAPTTSDPKAAAAAAAPSAADPKAAATAPPAASTEEAPKPNTEAPATGVNEAEAKALADAAAKATADKAASDAAAAAAAEAAAADAVPETYALDDKALTPEVAKFLKENGGLNSELLPALTPALKEAKLTQKQFAAVANAFLEFQEKLPQMMLAKDVAAVKADPVLGGLNFARSMEEVSIALDAFADPDFKKWTVQAGIANKPEFVRVFQRIGRAMRAASDSPVTSSPDAAPAETRAQRMYGRKQT